MLESSIDLHEQLLAAMRDLNARLHRHYSNALKVQGASLARLKLLAFIDRAEFVRSTDVAETFGFAPRTVTDALDALERDGLIQRGPDPSDRRVKRITLTATGRATLEKAAPLQRAITSQIFDAMVPEDEAELLRLLKLLSARLVELGAQISEDVPQRAAPQSGQN